MKKYAPIYAGAVIVISAMAFVALDYFRHYYGLAWRQIPDMMRHGAGETTREDA